MPEILNPGANTMSLAKFNFLYNQTDLDKVCADRELVTPEIHFANDFYGQASVIKRYLGYPENYRIKAVLEHAPLFSKYMWDQDRDAELAVNLCVSEERGKMISGISGKRSIPIGFGYYYAVELFKKSHANLPASDRKGSIVFPFKSTHAIKTEFDHADYAQRLLALPDEFHPIVCCIFWKDFLHGAHRAYQDAGIPVISAGHMFEPDFMLAFHDICRQFRYAISNEMGSYVFLTVASGLPFFYLQSGEIRRDIPEELQANYCRTEEGFERVNEHSKVLFREPVRKMTNDQQAFVDRILGRSFVRSPEELGRILKRTERYDRFMPLKRRGQRALIPWSAYAVRKSRKIRTKIGKYLGGRLASLKRKGHSIAKRIGRRDAA